MAVFSGICDVAFILFTTNSRLQEDKVVSFMRFTFLVFSLFDGFR